MESRTMPLPQELAMSDLIARVKADSSILPATAAAFLEDLASESPATLSRLKAVFASSEQENENSGHQS
jgi:hypothetical protein